LEHTSPEDWYVHSTLCLVIYGSVAHIGEEGKGRGKEKSRRRGANIQFALSYFLLFDAATLSSHAKPPSDAPHDVVPVHMSFVDWVPAICSTRTSSSVPLSALHSSSYQSPHILSLCSVILFLALRSQGKHISPSRFARAYSVALLAPLEELANNQSVS
jgi:hypothetical protein